MKRHHRLSGKLILLFLLLGLLIAVTVRTGFRYAAQEAFGDFAAPHLLEYVEHLRREIGNPPDRDAARALARRLHLQITLLSPQGSWATDGKPLDPGSVHFFRRRLSDGNDIEIGHDDGRLLVRIEGQDQTILLATGDISDNGRLPLVASLTILAVLAIIALTYHLVRRLFRPIETIRQGVARFGAGELEHRIRLHRRDELGELATSINTMADQIAQMLESKRQLLLAISHELRSPLTRARVNAELLDDSEPRRRIIEDLRQLELELSELLETERLGSRHARLDLAPVSPASLIEAVVERHFPEATLIRRQAGDEGEIDLDAVRVRLLIRNLLENALRHTPEGAEPPLLESRLEADGWTLTVSDQGPGIAPEHLPHLSEPFYRADKARQRQTGGYGLGLYLCRVIAQAHGGGLQIDSEPGRGTRVRVHFPR
ncbi:MAG: HAMP domain-containing sensor histidine kinase [Candidatus Thiodiazotropha sp.]